MNKLQNILSLGIVYFSFVSCNIQKEYITIDQLSSKKSIIMKLTLEDSTILGIKFPNKIKINNKSHLKKSIVKLNYSYLDSISKWRNLGIELHEFKNNRIKSISSTGKKIIMGNDNVKYFYYTRHFLDSSKVIQQQFKPYIEKMLLENKDTLHIGTVTAFKEKHKELFEKLTKGDSLSIQFLDGKKLGEKITVPVKW